MLLLPTIISYYDHFHDGYYNNNNNNAIIVVIIRNNNKMRNIIIINKGSEKPGTWHLAPLYSRIMVLAPLKSGKAQEIMLH